MRHYWTSINKKLDGQKWVQTIKLRGDNKNKQQIHNRGQKARIKNGKSQDTLSPYSNSGDHQFIPLKFRRLMNTSPKDLIWGYGGGPPTDQTEVRTEFSQLAANFRQKCDGELVLRAHSVYKSNSRALPSFHKVSRTATYHSNVTTLLNLRFSIYLTTTNHY